jgi:hypothetical protein
MNKREVLIYIMFFLFSFSCSSQVKTTYLINSIDTTTLTEYYILRISDSTDVYTVLSEKNDIDKGMLLDEGIYVRLNLNCIDGFKDSNGFIRVGRGYFVDGIKVFGKGQKLYQSDCLIGLNYICD